MSTFGPELEQKRAFAGIFGRAAATYDRVGPRFFSFFGGRLVEASGLARGAQVLDVATGRGAVLFPAADVVGPEGHITGIDLAEDMVRQTAAEIQARGVQNAHVAVMDAEALDFPDATFDAVFSAFGLFFFPQCRSALAGFRRVLKPGGLLAVSTWGGEDKHWEWLENLYRSYMPPPSAPPNGEPKPKEGEPVFDTPEGMRSLLTEAGFTVTGITPEEMDCLYSGGAEWWQAQWSHGRRYMLESLERAAGPEALDQFKREVVRRADSARQPDGVHELFTALLTLATKA